MPFLGAARKLAKLLFNYNLPFLDLVVLDGEGEGEGEMAFLAVFPATARTEVLRRVARTGETGSTATSLAFFVAAVFVDDFLAAAIANYLIRKKKKKKLSLNGCLN